MNDVDPSRIEIVLALECLEDAHLLMMPGQAPTSTREDILESVAATRPVLIKTLKHLTQAEALLSDEDVL